MKKITWLLLLLSLCLPFSALRAEEAETIPLKDLRELLKEHKTSVYPAKYLIEMMNAKERSEFVALFRNDPDTTRMMLLKRLEEKKQEKQAANAEIQRLSKEFRQSKDNTAKEQLRTQLRELIAKQYDQASGEIAARLKVQEQSLAEIRQQYQKRIESKEENIDALLDKATRKRAGGQKKATPEEKK